MVTTNGMVVKEGNTDTGTKTNVVKEAITPTAVLKYDFYFLVNQVKKIKH